MFNNITKYEVGTVKLYRAMFKQRPQKVSFEDFH